MAMVFNRETAWAGWGWASCLPGTSGGRSDVRRGALGAGRRLLPDRLRLVDQAAQAVAELATGAVQPAADRPHRDLEERADLLVATAVEVLEHDDGAMLGAEAIQ